MSFEDKRDEIIGKLAILSILAFIASCYFSWSDSEVYRLLGYNANAADDIGIFSRLFAIIAGTITGVLIGILAYMCKFILISITQFSNNSFAYVIIAWGIVLLGILGGSAIGVKQILLWVS